MEFDIIELTAEEVEKLTVIQLKLLRTAQKKKNDLLYALQKDMNLFKQVLMSNNFTSSSLYEAKYNSLKAEFDREVEILREQLIFNMSLNEPTNDDDLGGEGGDGPYPVDYSLSYLERYIVVRDYYLSIPDAHERLALYQADKVAMNYLSSYYNSLFNYLYSLAN